MLMSRCFYLGSQFSRTPRTFHSPGAADRASWVLYAEEEASECGRAGAQASEEPGISRQEGQTPAGQEEETGGAEAEAKVWRPQVKQLPLVQYRLEHTSHISCLTLQ